MNWTGLTEQLANTEEIENGKSNGALGEVFIRCNNVLYIG
jgi:small nuclear ribonucleoprotein F